MKNYNKLLEKAKEAYKNCATEGEKEVLKLVFPELAILDEKEIKNMIKAAVNQTAWLDSDKNLCYSWLEKQGEQKSDWSEDEKIAKELIRYLPYCDDIAKDTKERWIAWLEKQGNSLVSE